MSNLIQRRSFIFGLGATLAVIRTPGILMSIKPIPEITLEQMVTFSTSFPLADFNCLPRIIVEVNANGECLWYKEK